MVVVSMFGTGFFKIFFLLTILCEADVISLQLERHLELGVPIVGGQVGPMSTTFLHLALWMNPMNWKSFNIYFISPVPFSYFFLLCSRTWKKLEMIGTFDFQKEKWQLKNKRQGDIGKIVYKIHEIITQCDFYTFLHLCLTYSKFTLTDQKMIHFRMN